MRLNLLHENTDDKFKYLEQHILAMATGSTARKLIEFLHSKHRYTNPGDRHTSEVARAELERGDRLASTIWRVDIDSDTEGLVVLDNNKQVILALPENRDIAELLCNPSRSTPVSNHVIRGIAFGYEPGSVYKFAHRDRLRKPWDDHLDGLGIDLASNYGGYASVPIEDGWLSKITGVTTGGVIVLPSEVDKVKLMAPKLGKFLWALKYCPTCNDYVKVAGKLPAEFHPVKDHCPHGDLDGTYYNFEFDITELLPMLQNKI